jgi:hypothetical protein
MIQPANRDSHIIYKQLLLFKDEAEKMGLCTRGLVVDMSDRIVRLEGKVEKLEETIGDMDIRLAETTWISKWRPLAYESFVHISKVFVTECGNVNGSQLEIINRENEPLRSATMLLRILYGDITDMKINWKNREGVRTYVNGIANNIGGYKELNKILSSVSNERDNRNTDTHESKHEMFYAIASKDSRGVNMLKNMKGDIKLLKDSELLYDDDAEIIELFDNVLSLYNAIKR